MFPIFVNICGYEGKLVSRCINRKEGNNEVVHLIPVFQGSLNSGAFGEKAYVFQDSLNSGIFDIWIIKGEKKRHGIGFACVDRFVNVCDSIITRTHTTQGKTQKTGEKKMSENTGTVEVTAESVLSSAGIVQVNREDLEKQNEALKAQIEQNDAILETLDSGEDPYSQASEKCEAMLALGLSADAVKSALKTQYAEILKKTVKAKKEDESNCVQMSGEDTESVKTAALSMSSAFSVSDMKTLFPQFRKFHIYQVLKSLVEDGKLEMTGRKRGTRYNVL